MGGRTIAAQWALLAAGIVLIVPIMAFILAAAIVGIVVFMIAAMIFRVVAAVRGVFQGSSSNDDLTQPDHDGRVNVRVIREE